MTDLQELLDQIGRLELEIYPGPWVANDRGIGYEITTQQQIDEAAEVNGWPMPINSGIKDTFQRSDAEFIALARTALPVLARVVRTVIDSCEETIRDVNRQYSPDERDHGKHFHADMILDHITDALEGGLSTG